MAAVKALPCVACEIEFPDGRSVCGLTEVHHLLSGNKRRGHMFVLPLGAWHHRGVCGDPNRLSDMRCWYGPSLAEGSKPFRARYGTDDELLARVNALLAKRRAA